jgi:hypothetical protein
MRRAEGGAKIFGIFRVKNHDFTPKLFFLPILGGRAPGAPPGSAPDIYDTRRVIHMVKFVESLVGDRRKKTEQGKISMDI